MYKYQFKKKKSETRLDRCSFPHNKNIHFISGQEFCPPPHLTDISLDGSPYLGQKAILEVQLCKELRVGEEGAKGTAHRHTASRSNVSIYFNIFFSPTPSFFPLLSSCAFLSVLFFFLKSYNSPFPLGHSYRRNGEGDNIKHHHNYTVKQSRDLSIIHFIKPYRDPMHL